MPFLFFYLHLITFQSETMHFSLHYIYATAIIIGYQQYDKKTPPPQ